MIGAVTMTGRPQRACGVSRTAHRYVPVIVTAPIIQPQTLLQEQDIKVVEEEAGESGALNLPDEAVTAIAKCSSTLELHSPRLGRRMCREFEDCTWRMR
jgi:hypothetical protein